MNISQAAKLSGLSVKTVRYYADIKMVEPARDIQSGYRSYSNDDVSKLNFIGKARRFNFSIEECSCLLYTSPSPRDVEESRMPSSA